MQVVWFSDTVPLSCCNMYQRQLIYDYLEPRVRGSFIRWRIYGRQPDLNNSWDLSNVSNVGWWGTCFITCFITTRNHWTQSENSSKNLPGGRCQQEMSSWTGFDMILKNKVSSKNSAQPARVKTTLFYTVEVSEHANYFYLLRMYSS